MRRRITLAVVVAAAAGYAAFGLRVRATRAPRADSPAGEVRGAWHVHTTRSDGRGTLDEVVRAAKEAGLRFVVVADHNVLAPEEQGYRDGVLVVQATEASTRYGHVVALGVPRALDAAEREGDPLGAIARLGGEAVLAHPLHPRRPFSGWGTGPWRGFELLSNDTAWHEVVATRAVGKVVTAAAELPWDRARAVLALADDLSNERARFDAEVALARAAGRRPPRKVLLCSADAHGWPSYRAAFEAFSMHVPVALSGDGAADARAVSAALLDGRAACVLDGVAAASSVRLARGAADPAVLELSLRAPDLSRARFTLLRDGAPVGDAAPPVGSGDAVVRLPCGAAACAPGDYRVEATWAGRPWIFTNPLTIE
ncbi:MAG TPA: PHP domain-containing protein [Anaeromyxobacter sp.]|nr:PHP domain-containing protein [Anaeromyxobacter sp.]